MLSALFIALNTLFIASESYYFNLLPAAILIALLALFSLDKLILLVVFLTPLSINLKDSDVGLGLSLPAEPILFGIMVLFILKQLHESAMDYRVMNHPVTITILVNLAWIFITSLTSEMPVISFKFLVSRIWFLITFYFLAVLLFKKYPVMKKYNWLYIIPFAGVIVYTLVRHAAYGFEEKPANWVMTPFYNDHTIYGAILAMFLPMLVAFLFMRRFSTFVKLLTFGLLVLFVVATVFSYTRAAWVSLAGALTVLVFLLLRIRFRTLMMLFGAIVLVLIYYSGDIIMKLEKNKQDSSRDFAEHIQSVSNISSDASNLERLNRWSCAIRMFYERPVFGWGPGTYSFQYGPFQHKREETIISTHAGTGGNAHSEYIGPLSESGVLGALTFIAIVIAVMATGFKNYYAARDRDTKLLLAAVILGFTTYIVHGVMNNFLDTDKASAPFWGFVAIIVAIDIYHSNREESSTA